MSTRSTTSWCSGVPRPPGPTTPTACESSTITSASWRSARSQIAVELGEVAVHREDAVRRDQAVPSVGGLLEPRLELVHVAVRVAQPARLAEPDPVDDRGVVELIRDDRVLLAEQRLEQAAVRVEAGAEEDRVVGTEELGQTLLELAVQRLGAADEADRGHAVAPAVERLVGRLDDRRMVGEPEVVVRAEVEQLAAPGHVDMRALGRRDLELGLVEPGLAYLGERPGEILPQRSVHQSSSI